MWVSLRSRGISPLRYRFGRDDEAKSFSLGLIRSLINRRSRLYNLSFRGNEVTVGISRKGKRSFRRPTAGSPCGQVLWALVFYCFFFYCGGFLGSEPPPASGPARICGRHFVSTRLPRFARNDRAVRVCVWFYIVISTEVRVLTRTRWINPLRLSRDYSTTIIVSTYSRVAGSGTQPQGGEPPQASVYFRAFSNARYITYPNT